MLLTVLQLNLEAANPFFVNASIAADGDSISITFNEAVTFGAGGNGGIVITASGGASTATYSSGDTTDTLVYSLSRTIQAGETVTLSYTQPTDGIEAVDDNQDMASFSDEVVTNQSSVGAAVGGIIKLSTLGILRRDFL